MPESSSARNRTTIDYEVSGPNTVKIIVREYGNRTSVSTARVFSQQQADQLTEINRPKRIEPESA